MTRLTATEFDALEGLGDWRYLLGAISADFVAPSYAEGASLVAAIGQAGSPHVDVRPPGRVRVRLGLTEDDIHLARAISALARSRGATPESSSLGALEIAIDTMDYQKILPFWAAVLGYVPDGSAVVDPDGFGPALWFQQMDEPRTERQRFHLDVTVPHDQAEARIAAALDAGGRLVSDRRARAFWILADADGNEACVCTWQDRE